MKKKTGKPSLRSKSNKSNKKLVVPGGRAVEVRA